MIWNMFMGVIITCVILAAICVILSCILFIKDRKEYMDYLDFEEDEDEDISERTE